jgi:hypothetical protein
MNINLFPFTVFWMLLASVVVGLILYRKWIAKDEEDSLHVMDNEAGQVAQQAILAQKLETIDRLGKALTVAALAYGLVIGSAYLYQAWVISEHSLQ